jgi:hypothetical protein
MEKRDFVLKMLQSIKEDSESRGLLTDSLRKTIEKMEICVKEATDHENCLLCLQGISNLIQHQQIFQNPN